MAKTTKTHETFVVLAIASWGSDGEPFVVGVANTLAQARALAEANSSELLGDGEALGEATFAQREHAHACWDLSFAHDNDTRYVLTRH